MTKCCKPIQCMTPPGKVECICEFRLDERERFMFDLVASEHPGATAIEVDYYPFSRSKTKADPLYSEVITPGWDGPYRIRGIVTGIEPAPEVKDAGFKKMYSPTLWIARAELETAGARAPREGDVVRFWNLPYWEEAATLTPKNAIDGLYFNITIVTEDGILFDTPMFVGFSCSLGRNTEFTPERRVYDK